MNKADLELLVNGYQEARDDTFHDEFVDFLSNFQKDETITEDDVQGFIDSFDFPSEDEWFIKRNFK